MPWAARRKPYCGACIGLRRQMRRPGNLEPLVEIAPESRHPGLGKTARELLAALPGGQTVRSL